MPFYSPFPSTVFVTFSLFLSIHHNMKNFHRKYLLMHCSCSEKEVEFPSQGFALARTSSAGKHVQMHEHKHMTLVTN